MDEREKIIGILKTQEDKLWKMRFVESSQRWTIDINYEEIADALLAANVGDVTEWKETAEKETRAREQLEKEHKRKIFDYWWSTSQQQRKEQEEHELLKFRYGKEKRRAELAEENFNAIAKYYATDGISFCEVYRSKKDQEMCPHTGKGYLDCGSDECIECMRKFYTKKSKGENDEEISEEENAMGDYYEETGGDDEENNSTKKKKLFNWKNKLVKSRHVGKNKEHIKGEAQK